MSQPATANTSATQAKKVKTVKPKVASTKPAHPKFLDMIVEGLKSLNERTGSSRQALLKFIIAKYQLDEKVAKVNVKLAIKSGVKSGSLKQLKGTGVNGSFKIGDAIKNKTEKKVVKKTTEKKAGEEKPKKNVKRVVKPKVPKSTEAKKPVEKKKVAEKKKVVKAKVAKPTVEKAKKQVATKQAPKKAEAFKKTKTVKKVAEKKTVKK